jgi:hypothetical protein
MYDLNKNLVDRRELLKIKLAALVKEVGVIRRAEAKQKAYGKRVALPKPFLLIEMQDHRRKDLRRIQRLTGLALGFIRGKDLSALEPYAKNLLTTEDWKEIGNMIRKYGSNEAAQFLTQQIGKYAGKQYGTKPAHVFKTKVPHPAHVARKAAAVVPVTE